MMAVPDEPGKISEQKLRYKYESIEALKKEVNLNWSVFFFINYFF